MRRAPRLTRAQVVSRLRAHARAHGFVTLSSLAKHDPDVHRSVPLFFPGIDAARAAAAVQGAPFVKRRAKTGPKPGTSASKVRPVQWTKEHIIDELKRIDSAGHSTQVGALITAGYGTLVRTAQEKFGGLRRAREIAGIAAPKRHQVRKSTWTQTRVVELIRQHTREGESTESSRVPSPLYSAARRMFGSWRKALVAAGIEYSTLRKPTKFTRANIVARLQQAARAGVDLRAKSIAKIVNLRAITREFGTLRNALRSVGIDKYLAKRSHGGKRWSPTRVVEVLRERAARGESSTPPTLQRAMQKYFGGASAARLAAGVTDRRGSRTKVQR